MSLDGLRRSVIAAGAEPDGFSVVRLLPYGVLDPSFDDDGWASVDFGDASSEAYALALDAAGRIVAVGMAGGDIALALAESQRIPRPDLRRRRQGDARSGRR